MATKPHLDEISPLSPTVQVLRKKSLIHEQVDLAQKQLLGCIDSLTKNSSIFTRLSLFWSQLPWWQKVTTGSLLCIPLLIGLISQVSLLSLFGLNLILFSSLTSFLADNHAQHHQQQTEEIKATVLSLIKLLGTMIENLGLINTQLGEELNLIKKSNLDLSKKCYELQEEIKHLTSSNQSLEQNQQELVTVQKKLKTTKKN